MTSKLVDYIEAGKALDADEPEIAAPALQQVDELTSGEVKPVSCREAIAIARVRSATRRR